MQREPAYGILDNNCREFRDLMPMNHLDAEHLPWRVAALAGLIVGGISLAYGSDVWTCLIRVGAAFLLFGLAGLALRAVMQIGSAPPKTRETTHLNNSSTTETKPEVLKPEVLNSDTLK